MHPAVLRGLTDSDFCRIQRYVSFLFVKYDYDEWWSCTILCTAMAKNALVKLISCFAIMMQVRARDKDQHRLCVLTIDNTVTISVAKGNDYAATVKRMTVKARFLHEYP